MSATRVSGATMMDVGERYRPPGDPSDTSTWASKVVGSTVGGMPNPEDVLDDEFVTARVALGFSDGEDGEPEVTIGQEVLEAINGLWK